MNQKNSFVVDPTNLPLTMKERVAFNISVFFIVITTMFFFALFVISNLSLATFLFSLVWAAPGLIILAGFFSSRNLKKLSRFRKFLIIGEALFAIYMVLLAMGTQAAHQGLYLEDLVFNFVVVVLYIISCEIIYNLLVKHENAYYNENLKGIYLTNDNDGKDNEQ